MTEILQQGKFDRIVELIVQRDGQAYAITNLLIDFRIQKFPGAVDNRGVIRIYNLRSNVRGLLHKRIVDSAAPPFTTVFLSAGYRRDGIAKLIFKGVVITGKSSRIGPDWITEIDGLTAHQQKSASFCTPELTFGPTPPLVMANRLFDQLLFGKPQYSTEALSILNGAPPVRFAFTGRVDRSINILLDRYNLIYSLEDTGPFVVRNESAADPDIPSDNIPSINLENGLINTPKITERGVELRTLLNSDFRLFHRFKLQSETINESLAPFDREFTCYKLEHVGSNRGEDFFTNVTGSFFPRVEFNAAPAERPANLTVNPVQVGS